MDKFAVIGNPVRNSLSPKIHTNFAERLGINLSYEAIEINKEDFEKKVNKLFEQGYKGLNVTLPLKQLAFLLANEVTAEAEAVKAVNTLWLQKDKIYADTTDGRGFIEDLKNNEINVEDLSILLLGAGGAAKSIVPSLVEMRPKEIFIINRTESKAADLVEMFPNNEFLFKIASVQKNMTIKVDGIINTSSAGLLGEKIILPSGLFDGAKWVYDLTYSKKITPFNLIARDNGVEKSLDGLGMLVQQAALSFEIWTGQRPDTKGVLRDLKSSFK